MKTFPELEEEVRQCKEALNNAENALFNARVDALPVKVGDVIRTHRGDLKIISIRPSYGYPKLTAVPRLKNGEWGIRETHIYSKYDELQKVG